tara:strand:+ start:1999 stop:2976 length:978 start_codon:yes stop_codon:yes gene_type:complete
MKILFLNRALTFGGFSFEELFSTIKKNLVDCEIDDFYDKTYSNLYKNIRAVKEKSADIYHITGGIGFYALFLPTKKTILTIHDTNYYEFHLTGIKKWIFGLLFYKLPILNVKYVTVVSEHTKNNLIKFFGINPQKIKVISNCFPANFKTARVKEANDIPSILHIGTKSNKNLIRLLEAINGLEVKLTIIGKVSDQIKSILSEANINYTNKYNLSQKEIYAEYINCDIVYFASLHEGFGLPIIEANIIGRPIITSNISPMKEIAGEHACLVNPYSVDEIKTNIQKIISDKTYRLYLIDNGIKNAQQYSPKKIAQLYKELYTSVNND